MSMQAEEVVLGALLIDTAALDVVFAYLKTPKVFYKAEHGLIFSAIQSLAAASKKIDLVTVADELKRSGKLEAIGRELYLIDLSQKVSSAANVEEHCQILNFYYFKRELVRLGADLKTKGFEPGEDPTALVNDLQHQLDEITGMVSPAQYKDWQQVLTEVTKDITALSEARESGGMLGLPSGLTAIDDVVGGWLPGELIILAARPGMGKTAMVVKWLAQAASMGHCVAIMQLEMSDTQFAKRVLALEVDGLHANQLYKHGLHKTEEWEKYTNVIEKVKDYKLHVVPQPGMSISECVGQARRLKKEHNLEMLVVDYLQLMSGSKDGRAHNREQEISEVSRKLKALSLELQIPVVALSQLSRSVETRGGAKRPLLSDLRESGSIEQDADMVCFLYRPEYYGIQEMEDGSSSDGKCEFIIGKHRNGLPGTVDVGFNSNKVKFHNLSEVTYAANEDEQGPF